MRKQKTYLVWLCAQGYQEGCDAHRDLDEAGIK